MNWQYFILGVIIWPFIKVFAVAVNRAIIEHRQKKFLKMVIVTFPDRKDVTLISLDTSDKRSMKRLEREFRERYDIPEDPTNEARYHRGGGFHSK